MERIKPIFMQNYVPVCFSANDKYIPLLSTELASIIEHSSADKYYDLVILTTGVSDENQFKLMSQIRNHPNFSIRFVNVGQTVYGYDFYLEPRPTNTKYSSEIYFRILVPTIMQDYDYVIFCDADIVFQDDIAKLLDYDYSQNIIGGVRDYEGIANCYNNNYERTKYRITELGIKSFDNYFVSGVLVINTKKFNELYSEKQLLDLAVSKKWIQYDQDLLNFICKDDVKIIDAEWNFVEDIDNVYHSLPSRLFNEYEKSEKTPKAIHYSGNRKPWINLNSKFSSLFWKYAERTPFSTSLKELRKID